MARTKKATEKVNSKANSELKADVYNIKGEKIGSVALQKEVFGTQAKPALIAQAVRVYLENQRQGTRKVKTRSEVTGSTRKLFRQKGTGRARTGSIKSPIHIGGGIAHGPKINDFHLNMPQKMRRVALFSALSQKFKDGSIKIIDNLDKFPPKTKNMHQFLQALNPVNKKKNKLSTLLITDKMNQSITLAGRNLPDFAITQVSQLNTYQVLQNKNVLFLKSSLEFFKPKTASEEKAVKKTVKIQQKKVEKKVKTSTSSKGSLSSGQKGRSSVGRK